MFKRLIIGLLAICLHFNGSIGRACPFCSAVSQTLRQEMAAMDAVAIGVATEDSIRDEATGKVTFKVSAVLKGESLVKPDETVTAVYYGKVEPGRRFMLSGADPSNLQWACLPLTDTSEKYLLDLMKVPDDPLERLKFYQAYLQHSDSMLNRDAYDEFAIAPYSVVDQLKPFINHDQLITWLSDPELPADRKRLYLTMLGVCGSEKDLPMLGDMLRSTQLSTRGGLDALIACYLTLAGERGLATVNELFLANQKTPYADIYAAIMAIRFHGTETNKIPRSALVQSLHLVLERPDLADLVIPDLARWGDWTQIERLEKLFLAAEPGNNWIRVPVVNYLRTCPEPKAAETLERLKEIDPDSVKRASSVFSIPTPSPASRSELDDHRAANLAGLVPTAGNWSGPSAANFNRAKQMLAIAPQTEHGNFIAAGLPPAVVLPLTPAASLVNLTNVTCVTTLILIALGCGLTRLLTGRLLPVWSATSSAN